jgi:hypothetical protein
VSKFAISHASHIIVVEPPVLRFLNGNSVIVSAAPLHSFFSGSALIVFKLDQWRANKFHSFARKHKIFPLRAASLSAHAARDKTLGLPQHAGRVSFSLRARSLTMTYVFALFAA